MAEVKKQAAEEKKKGDAPAFRIVVNDADKQLVEVAAVWKKTSKAGNEFYSGKVAQDIALSKGEYINVFVNVPKK